MTVDVYSKRDILNILRAIYTGGDGPAALLAELAQDSELGQVPLEKVLRIYRQGFNTALGAVGLAFGMEAHPVQSVGTCFPASAQFAVERGGAPTRSARGEAAGAEAERPGVLWMAQLDR